MSTEIAKIPAMSEIENILINGDVSKLSEDQRIAYYKQQCDNLKLNPLSKPFDYIWLNNKLVMYANKGCAEQLRQVHKISIRVTDKKQIGDIYVVTAEASQPDGRVDSATGAVNVANLKGDALANAFMKAETKAKRRVTLSLLGLNMLDESEVETIKQERPAVTQSPAKPVAQTDTFDPPTEISGYKLPFGDYIGKRLSELTENQILEVENYLEAGISEKRKKKLYINPQALEALDKVREFLKITG